MKNNFSKNYRDLIKIYEHLHKNGTNLENSENTFDGKSLFFYFELIKQLIEKTKSKSLIDFGCGKAKYYFNNLNIKENEYKNICEYWGIKDYYLYDPGVEEFSNYPPEPKDGVICVDVVEHIPPEDVFKFIEDIFKLAKKFIFIVIACYPAVKTLPDGRNAHLSLLNPSEWKVIISMLHKRYPNILPHLICTKGGKLSSPGEGRKFIESS